MSVSEFFKDIEDEIKTSKNLYDRKRKQIEQLQFEIRLLEYYFQIKHEEIKDLFQKEERKYGEDDGLEET